ncbi:phosphatidylglycerophosphate synthase, putative [Eimeria necatrix]|uniref:CDP-diacylglycerol--glycerol-3-phosphate 3-phosphatidyltransferase n=1 Tax=Eimeria necatrix TaxID=51315 RepID=U6MR96_9EIME|nr:phosphatidylglycerophosphate synthase, putative [Eimeria necatrix]CDJ66737.1 phosphatidylglycerophosphate synthase, putative [Eimeria necatrix]
MQDICVPVAPRCVSIVRGPQAFYSAVLALVGLARRRLLLSALYIGTGHKERFMLQLLQQRIQQQQLSQQKLEVRLLLDFLRTTRPDPAGDCPASLLQPLLSEYPVGSLNSTCQVSLFCNPLTCSNSSSTNSLSRLQALLRKFLFRALGHRAREALGTQHMKCLVSDDLILLTGANLSDEYFGKRMDRCFVLRSRALADAADSLIAAAEAHSFKLLPSKQYSQQWHRQHEPTQGRIVQMGKAVCWWPPTNPSEPPQTNPEMFCSSLANSLAAALTSTNGSASTRNNSCSSSKSLENVNGSNNFRNNDESNSKGCSSNYIGYSRLNSNTGILDHEMCLVSLTVQAGFVRPPLRGQEWMLERIYGIAANSLAALGGSEAPTAADGEYVSAPGGLQVALASPYLNFPVAFLRRLQQLLQQMRLSSSCAVPARGSYNNSTDRSACSNESRLVVVTASPQANSFFNSRGISYWIPPAYAVAAYETAVALEDSIQASGATDPNAFSDVKMQHGPDDNLLLLEFARPGWTYHAKGIWISPTTSAAANKSTTGTKGNGSNGPAGGTCLGLGTTRALLQSTLSGPPASLNKSSNCDKGWAAVCLLGSSNLSVRSSERDLELLCMLRTRDKQLQRLQQQELTQLLLPFCHPLDRAKLIKRFPPWLHFAVQRLGLNSFL